MRKQANLFMIGLTAALLVGNTGNAFAVEACDEKYTDCEEVATAKQAHRKADCRKILECESIADKNFDADKAVCEAAKKRCEAGDAKREAVKAAQKEAKAKQKTLASLGGGGAVKAKGKSKTPNSAKPPTANAQASANCAEDADAKAAADALRNRFADARAAGGTANALRQAWDHPALGEQSAPRNPPLATPVR